MKALGVLTVCVIAALAGGASASDMPGPDCSKVTAPDMRTVCESPSLTKLDVEASTLYEVRMMLPMLMGERGAAQDENQAFQDKRTACGTDAACLQSA